MIVDIYSFQHVFHFYIFCGGREVFQDVKKIKLIRLEKPFIKNLFTKPQPSPAPIGR